LPSRFLGALRYNAEHMSEALRGIPEAYQQWKPKPSVQTMAEIDRTAAFIQDINESVERFWEKQAERERMRQQDKIPWWVYLVALLGALVPSNYQERESYSSDV
jgi:hypothetical protein